MKFALTVCVFLLTVSSSLSANITVTGTEGRSVSITCLYPGEQKNAYKYFYRGLYSNRVLLVESDGMQAYAISGRFYLQDNRQSSFTVTISTLRMEDAGLYGCKAGYGSGNYKLFELIVDRAPETTRPVQISTTTIHPLTDTGSDHTSTAVRPDLSSVAVGLGLVLLVLALCCGMCLIRKKRKRKRGTALNQQNLQYNPETDHMDEIPNTDFTAVTPSSNQTPSLQLNNDFTVYPTVTNQQPDSNPSHTYSTNQVTDTNCDYYANIKWPEAPQDNRTELIYSTATHPQNITTDEDPLNAPRFCID